MHNSWPWWQVTDDYVTDFDGRAEETAWVPTYIYIIQISPTFLLPFHWTWKNFFSPPDILLSTRLKRSLRPVFPLFQTTRLSCLIRVLRFLAWSEPFLLHRTQYERFGVGGMMPWVIPNRQDINLWSILSTACAPLRITLMILLRHSGFHPWSKHLVLQLQFRIMPLMLACLLSLQNKWDLLLKEPGAESALVVRRIEDILWSALTLCRHWPLGIGLI